MCECPLHFKKPICGTMLHTYNNDDKYAKIMSWWDKWCAAQAVMNENPISS